MDTYELVGNGICKFYEEYGLPDTTYVVCFFEQKYTFEEDWDKEIELAYIKNGDVYFDTDFCEGQTEMRNLVIKELYEILNDYRVIIIEKGE